MNWDWFFAAVWAGLALAWLVLARNHYRSEREYSDYYALRGWNGWKSALLIAALNGSVCGLYVWQAAA